MAMKNDRKMRETADNLQEDLQTGLDEGTKTARATARSMKNTASRTANHIAEDVNEAGQEGVSSLEELAEHGGRVVRDFYARGEAWAGRAGDQVEDKVHERPLLMLLGAFVAGAMLAKMFRT